MVNYRFRLRTYQARVRELTLKIMGERMTGNVAIPIACAIALSACAANSSSSSSDLVRTGTVFSAGCERGWADCYTEAQRRCANGDFEEIDRNTIETAAIDNRSVESTQTPIKSIYLSVTFRCK